MMTFFEYITRRHGVDPLGTPEEMLARAGIWPSVPHEVVIQKMLKRWKKQRLVPARPAASAKTPPNLAVYQSANYDRSPVA